MGRDDGEAKWESFFETVRGHLAGSGYHLTYVADDPPFCYSVGFGGTWDHPELLLFGLGFDDSRTILTGLAEQVRGGRRFAHGSIDHETFNRPLAFVDVPPRCYFEHFNVTIEIYDGTDFEALQVVTPDPQGRFPWDEGCDTNLVTRQPLLGVPPGQAQAS